MRWRSISSDPNAPAVVAARDATLKRAFAVEHRDRVEVFAEFCRDKRVLDVGCVDHSVQQTHLPSWLHGQLAGVAKELVGVDIEPAGITAMRNEGYDAIEADISGDITEILARGPFDVVVAGELIEHLDAPAGLFHAASQILKPGGVLLLSTPNPFSPIRARRGAHGETWESVDHVAYYPPTGIAELAERAGMRLTRSVTVGHPRSRRMFMRSIKRWVLGQRDHSWTSPLDVLIYRTRARLGQLGVTAIYVVTKPV